MSNTVSTSLLQIVSYGAPLFVLPLIANKLGYDQFSVFIVIISLVQFGKVFADYGFNVYGVEALSKSTTNVEANHFINRILLSKTLIITPITLVCIFLVIFTFYDLDISQIIIILGIILINGLYPGWVMSGLERFDIHLQAQFISKLTYVALIFIVDDLTLTDVLILVLLTSTISTAYSLLKVSDVFVGFKFTITGILVPLQKAFPYFFSTSLAASYNLLPASLLGFSGSNEVGFYGIADHIYKAGQSASFPVTQTLLPYLARTKNLRLFAICLGVFLFLGVCLILLVKPYLKTIIIYFFGLEFLPALDLIYIFLVIIPINFLAVMSGYPLFSIINRSVIAARIAIMGGGIFWVVVAVLLTGGLLTAQNICVTILLVEIMVLIIRVLVFRRVATHV